MLAAALPRMWRLLLVRALPLPFWATLYSCGSIYTATLGSWQVRGLLTPAASDAAPLQLRAYSVLTS
ncbi:unnamed protein product [Closterium sp. NIES-64]|nr:unnamed protein product [Closterium sp. NIES-64]